MMKQLFLILLSLSFLLSMTSCEQGEKFTHAEIETDFGTIKVKLYNDTPKHRDNFIKLAKEGFYDDLLFHRIIPGFMMQGGDPDSKDATPQQRLGAGGLDYLVDAELGHLHYKGALAAARTGGPANPEKKSSSCQFYIVQGKPVTEQQLDMFSKQKGMTLNEAQRKKYLEVGGAPFLDMDYTVYGEVVEGLDVVDKVCAVQTASGDRPLEDVKMKVRIVD